MPDQVVLKVHDKDQATPGKALGLEALLRAEAKAAGHSAAQADAIAEKAANDLAQRRAARPRRGAPR